MKRHKHRPETEAVRGGHDLSKKDGPISTPIFQTSTFEVTDAALLFASGMSAITTSVLALVKAGDHIVAQRDIYGGATKFFTQWLPKFGVEITFVDTVEYDQHARAIRPNTK